MYGIGAGCPGANVLGHHRMGRLTLEHRLNHPRPKEIVTFLTSTAYMAPVGALYADVIVVGNGGAGSPGAAGGLVSQPPAAPVFGGTGGAGGAWGSRDAVKLVAPTYTIVIGLTSSFQSISTSVAGPSGGAGGASYSMPSGFVQPGTVGSNGTNVNRLLFTGAPVCASGGGGGGSGWIATEPSYMPGFNGGTPYGGAGGGKYGSEINAGSNGSPAAAGSGGGGGGGGCGLFFNMSGYAYAAAGGQGGAGGTGVVQIRFRREF